MTEIKAAYGAPVRGSVNAKLSTRSPSSRHAQCRGYRRRVRLVVGDAIGPAYEADRNPLSGLNAIETATNWWYSHYTDESVPMVKIIVPVDGSESSVRAALVAAGRDGAEIYLLNVQPHLPELVSSMMEPKAIDDHYETEGSKSLAPAEKALNEAGVQFHHLMKIGPAAETISNCATQEGCEEIVMGARGHGSVLNLLLGSVSTKVLSLSDKPVTLVK